MSDRQLRADFFIWEETVLTILVLVSFVFSVALVYIVIF